VVEVQLVDMRERELTIKGQEILTADKVAVRVSIVTQFRVVDPTAAIERVAGYEDRLYSDVQLAARRSLARPTGRGRRGLQRAPRPAAAARTGDARRAGRQRGGQAVHRVRPPGY
jgi:regulator of protease activity HflC (stomatin/prohibitin superfamily)